MKRMGKVYGFALFGATVELFALTLLQQFNFLQYLNAFVLSAIAFMSYRIYINYEKEDLAKNNFLQKQLRGWWIRQKPEANFSFAIVGGLIVVASNPLLWLKLPLINIWAMGFAASGLTHLLFEKTRERLNQMKAYLVSRKKMKVLGGEKNAKITRIGFDKESSVDAVVSVG